MSIIWLYSSPQEICQEGDLQSLDGSSEDAWLNARSTLWDLRINEGLSLAAWCHVQSHKSKRIQPSMRSPDSGAESLKGCIWGLFDISTSTSDIILHHSLSIYLYIHAYSGAGTSIFHSHDIHAAPGTMPCRIRRHGGNPSPVPGMDDRWVIMMKNKIKHDDP